MEKKSNKIAVFGLIMCMILCTMFTVGGVFASKNQILSTNGSVTVESFGHVDATIKIEIAEASFTKEITIDETAAKTTYAVEGFAEALQSAFHGNVEATENDGRIEVKDTATVKITITNTSVDYDLDSYSIALGEANLVNMKPVVVTGEANGSDVARNGGSVEITYVIQVNDTRISASGDYSWTLTLAASND